MRDTSDMMEDALSEDTMMDCGGDGRGLEDLVDLATDIADSSPSIQDAAERLLTLLGVDDVNDDLLSSSEDEGVEVDGEEIDDDTDTDEPDNTRLLHQLAASLAQELKYSQQKPSSTSSHANSSRSLTSRSLFEPRDQKVQALDVNQDISFFQACRQNQSTDRGFMVGSSLRQDQNPFDRKIFGQCSQSCQDVFGDSFQSKDSSLDASGIMCLDHRLSMDELKVTQDERSVGHLTGSWGAGWDACATEALRYLVEDEGLPPHHPTVLAMKNHLELQRERAFALYTS